MFHQWRMLSKGYLYLWAMFLLHAYVILHSSTPVDAKAQSSMHMVSSRCPFHQAKAFLGRPTALMASSLGFYGESTNGGASANTAPLSRREIKMLASRRFPQLQSLGGYSYVTYSPSISNSYTISHTPYTTPRRTSLRMSTGVSVDQPVASDGPSEQPRKAPKKKRGGAEALEVVVIGLSHHNAKVEVREKLAVAEADWNAASAQLCAYESISEAVVLSTCNRFEIYLSGVNQYEVMRDALDFLTKRSGLDAATLHRNLFLLSAEDCIWHLYRVSAGLDSLVVGEGQILSQVKKAYEHGIESSGSAGKVLARLLNTAVSAGKRVRSETGISKGAVSISSAAAEFSAFKLPHTSPHTSDMAGAGVVLVGAGKMARLLLIHLETQGVKQVTVVNRSPERVAELQAELPNVHLSYTPFSHMYTAIQDADIVYPCTASMDIIVNAEPLREAMGKRTRPGGVQFVDISVPRNVHPDCSNIPNVFSYNVDDLKQVVERNTAKRRREMIEAEIILRDEMGKFRLWQQSLGAIPTINKLQEKAEALRSEELRKASAKLSALSAKDLEIVEKVTKGIVAKLLHGPMNHLRQQTEGGEQSRQAIQQVQQAFQLVD